MAPQTWASRGGISWSRQPGPAGRRPALIGELARRFGAQCVVASMDARRASDKLEVYIHGGTRATGLAAVSWARCCAELCAGEVLLTSIDRDGRRDGYDLELTSRVVEAVSVSVIASGGAGKPAHFRDAFLLARADAALAAGIFHDGTTTVAAVKRELPAAGVPVRPPPAEWRRHGAGHP